MGMGIVSSAMLGALSGLGQGIATAGKMSWEEQMEARKQATRLEQEKTLMALKEQFSVNAENRQRAADLAAGQDIAAGGAAAAAKYATQPGVAADGTLTVDGAGLDKPKVSRADQLRSDADYARSKGHYKQADQITRELENERRFSADEARAKTADRRNEILDKAQTDREIRAEEMQKLLIGRDSARESAKETSERRAATVAAMQNTQASIKALEDELKNEFDDKAKGPIRAEIAKLRSEAARYRSALGSAGIDGGTPSGRPSLDSLVKPLGAAAPASPASPLSSTLSDTQKQPAATDSLSVATPKQLFAALQGNDPLAAKYAKAELIKRGMLSAEADSPGIVRGAMAEQY